MSSEIGQDTIFYTSNNGKKTFIVVHFSSSDNKILCSQIEALKKHCSESPDMTFIIMGDFNSIPKQSSNSANTVKFYNKDFEPHQLTDDNFLATISFENRNVHVSNITTPTTCKERIITVQLVKLLKKVSADIDGIIIIEPVKTSTIFDFVQANPSEANPTEASLSEGNLSEANPTEDSLSEANLNEVNLSKVNLNEVAVNKITSITSGVKIFEKDIDGECIAPFEWPSDHYVVHSTIHFENMINESDTNQLMIGS